MSWRAFHGPVGAEHAAVAGPRPEQRPARRTVEKVLAGVGRHRRRMPVLAQRTGEFALQFQVGTSLLRLHSPSHRPPAPILAAARLRSSEWHLRPANSAIKVPGHPIEIQLSTMSSFSAVSIVTTGACCDAARTQRASRTISNQAPRLPLPDCSMPDRCRCRFAKHADRREGDDRRAFHASETSAWYNGPERRKASTRRSTRIMRDVRIKRE